MLDMMRGRAVCKVAKIMVRLQPGLVDVKGIPELAVGSETVGIRSARNKIRFTAASGDLDPTHHRFILNNLIFSHVSPLSQPTMNAPSSAP